MAHFEFPVDYTTTVNNHAVPEAITYFDMIPLFAEPVQDDTYQSLVPPGFKQDGKMTCSTWAKCPRFAV